MLVPYPHSLESKLVYFLLARLVLVLVPALAVLSLLAVFLALLHRRFPLL